METIIAPQAIITSSDLFVTWQQARHKDGSPGRLCFFRDNDLASMTLVLEKQDGLNYAPTDVYMVDWTPVQPTAPRVCQAVNPACPSLRQPWPHYVAVTKSNQTESELWMLRLGSPDKDQSDMLPGNAIGIPSVFEYHLFHFLVRTGLYLETGGSTFY